MMLDSSAVPNALSSIYNIILDKQISLLAKKHSLMISHHSILNVKLGYKCNFWKITLFVWFYIVQAVVIIFSKDYRNLYFQVCSSQSVKVIRIWTFIIYAQSNRFCQIKILNKWFVVSSTWWQSGQSPLIFNLFQFIFYQKFLMNEFRTKI